MRKYGFIKHSLVDYPGEVCSVVFLPGCNFCCPYCHNKNLVESIQKHGWTLKEILDYLQRFCSIITSVCITGGEPTLYPETLHYLVDLFKKFGFKVKVDSNGSVPDQIENLNQEVDYFAMDLKTSIERYSELTQLENIQEKIKASMELLMRRNPDSFEFRTTLDWNFVDEDSIHDLGKYLRNDTRWYLQRCRLKQKLLPADYAKETEKIEEFRVLAETYTNFVFLRQ